MKKVFLLLPCFCISSLFTKALSQTPPIEVAQNTLKVSGFGEETFYYGFAEGDQVIFDFEEVNHKELKEVEILEWPSNSKFMDYKTKKIEGKILTIAKTGVYQFRFANSALSGRVCRFRIQRIPSGEATQHFNTSVYWRTLNDSSYTPLQERYLVKSDTSIVTIVDQSAKVSSKNALNGNPNRTIVDFALPEGTVSWSYYLGTGNEAKQAFGVAKEKFLNTAAAGISKIPGYGPMGALALYGYNYFAKVQGEDNVKYWFIKDWNNVLLFQNGQSFYQYKQGDVVNDASQMTVPTSGKVYLALLNDNIAEPIDVTVKISAVVVNQQWGTRTVKQLNIQQHKEPYLKN